MLTEADRYSIKSLTKEAVEEAGGYEACSTISRVKRAATFGDYINDPRYLVPFDVAIEIDRYLLVRGRQPMFGDRFADLIGHVLVKPPQATSIGMLTEHSSKSAENFGRMMADILTALADGHLSEGEARRILADVQRLMIDLAGIAELVRARVDEGDR